LAYLYNYLLFHSIIEIISVIIAISVFIIVVNTRKLINEDAFFNIIGSAFFFVGALDFLHTLSYYGMGVFPDFDKNLPTQIWIVSRYCLSFTFLIGLLLNKKKINFYIIFVVYFIIFIAVLLSVFYFKIFPDCYIEGTGLTPFKIVSEFIISFMFLINFLIVLLKKKDYNKTILIYIFIFFISSLFSDIFFALYKKINDVINFSGHWFKLLSYLIIYKIFIEISFKQPYLLLFKDLKESKEKYVSLFEELKEKNNDLEQIIYIISHDLRTPMTNIQGFTKAIDFSVEKILNLINSKKDRDEIKKEVDVIAKEEINAFKKYIQSSIVKIDSLITGLLHIAQIGRDAINISKIDLNNLINEVLSSLDFIIKKNKIRIEVGNLPPCMGDNIQINQIFYNLIDNAIKYSDEKKESFIKIWGENRGDYNLYCVEDNGIGIDKKDQVVIFDIFKKVNPNKTTGEGLGLSIVTKILLRHKGKIWVESDKGKGSKFYFTLPVNLKNEDIKKS
jgi:signal transduction histidine kinase